MSRRLRSCVKHGESTRAQRYIAEALRSRGFRKVKDDWVESAPAAPVNSSTAAGTNSPQVAIVSQGLLGLTADEVTRTPGGQTQPRQLRRLERTIDRTENLPS